MLYNYFIQLKYTYRELIPIATNTALMFARSLNNGSVSIFVSSTLLSNFTYFYKQKQEFDVSRQRCNIGPESASKFYHPYGHPFRPA